jgi:hypothetical protein
VVKILFETKTKIELKRKNLYLLTMIINMTNPIIPMIIIICGRKRNIMIFG